MKDIYWQLLRALWFVSVGASAISTYLVCRYFTNSKRKTLSDSELPGVSIFKPVRGPEDGISENLESFFNLDYTQYELLFSVAEADDKTIPAIRALIAKYPKIDARLIIGAVEVGPNPKVNNMMRSYRQSKYGVILISDSNVRVRPNYLRNMVSNLDPDVGIITSVLFGMNPKGIGGLLETTFLMTWYTKMLTLLSTMGMPCVIGKSMMFRKETLEKLGGMARLKDFIAEDYSCGRMIMNLGMKVAVEREALPQWIGNYSFDTFWNRHVRWGRIRKLQNIAGFIAELLTGSVGSGIIGAIMARHFWHAPMHIFLPAHFTFWLICDMIVMNHMGRPPTLKGAVVWVLREMSHVPLWFQIAASNTILWRGQKLKLNLGGTINSDVEVSLEEAAGLKPLTSKAQP